MDLRWWPKLAYPQESLFLSLIIYVVDDVFEKCLLRFGYMHTWICVSRPLDESMNYNQVGKEVKGRAHTYYQVLIDSRDCPYIVSSLSGIYNFQKMYYMYYELNIFCSSNPEPEVREQSAGGLLLHVINSMVPWFFDCFTSLSESHHFVTFQNTLKINPLVETLTKAIKLPSRILIFHSPIREHRRKL